MAAICYQVKRNTNANRENKEVCFISFGRRTYTTERLNLLEEHKHSIKEQIRTLKAADEMLEYKITTYKDFINKRD